jgi:hypothetical protein
MYKILEKRFYKNGNTFNTSEINYGKTGFGIDTKNLSQFLNPFFQIVKSYRISFEDLAKITINISNPILKHHYFELLESEIDPIRYDCILLSGSQDVSIKRRDFKLFFDSVSEQENFFNNPAADAPKIWEYLYEKVRQEHFPHLPSRLNSFFSFKHLEDIAYYKEKHITDGLDRIKCKLDISGCNILFESDMAILDEIEPNSFYPEVEEKIKNYWQQKYSKSPVIEILLQGEITLLEELE